MTTEHTPDALALLLAGPVNEPQINLVGEYQTGLFCGLEDRGLQGDPYEACLYGFEAGVEHTLEWAQGLAQDAEDQNRLKMEAFEELKVGFKALLKHAESEELQDRRVHGYGEYLEKAGSDWADEILDARDALAKAEKLG